MVRGTEAEEACRRYIRQAMNTSYIERSNAEKDKTGVHRPLCREPGQWNPDPRLSADYVMMDYSTAPIIGCAGP